MPAIAAPQSPLYVQVRDALRQEIHQRLRPGSLLPTQRELAEQFGTSLITIKRAVTELAQLGLVETVRGRGTVVRRPTVVDAHTGISSWTDSMRGLGGNPRTAWTRIELERGDGSIRRLLRVRAHQTLTVVRRLRTLNSEPVCLMNNYLPTRLVQGLDVSGFDAESLYEVLDQRYGLTPAYADEEVTARPAKPDEQKALAEHQHGVLEIRRTCFNAADEPIEFACLVAPTTRYTYRVRVHASPDS